jgi:hypothetical protein
MARMHGGRPIATVVLAVIGGMLAPLNAWSACCYFSAKNADILQPGQKVFITWDPEKKVESFTVQPKFEGNALDFGMVIPTPAQPKLHEMPRDFFKHLAYYTILARREFPDSKLLPRPKLYAFGGAGGFSPKAMENARDGLGKSTIKVLETGVVGSLDYKIIEAGRADDLFKWLKDNKYSYSGDEATLNFYVAKKWLFTVMKIDTMQMKKNKDGSYAGEVTPTRFQFASEQLVYPLKITQISVKDTTEALFYVQAPYKTDLPGDWTYQYQWAGMLQTASGCTPGGLPGRGADWLKALELELPTLNKQAADLGFAFQVNRRPTPNAKGHTATTMEWARRLSAEDIAILQGKAAYSEKLPNVDEGFTEKDLADPKKREMVIKTINDRLEKANKERPYGYLVRHLPDEDLRGLQQLVGHLQAGLFITKFRKIFARDEMNDDLLIIPARRGRNEDSSEYQEILPTSPP